MKTSLLVSAILMNAIVFAQQKQAPAKVAPAPAKTIPAKTPAVQTATPAASEKDKFLCKAWKTTFIESFGTINPPDEKQKNDGVTFTSDGIAFLTFNGAAKTGKWSFDKPKANVTITIDDSTEKFKFKVLSLTAEEFKYEYQDPDLIRTKYTCAPLKK